MDYRQLTFTLLFICSTIAVEVSNPSGLYSASSNDLTNTARPFTNDDELPKLRRQKRQDIEIHRVIKRRPKLPPPIPRGRKPRPPRRPPKPKVKYGPPNVNYPPLSHYNPHSFDDSFSQSFETTFSEQNSFGEPPNSYGNPIHPSPAFGSPPFAYGQGTTVYQGASFGKPNIESANFEGLGKPPFSSSNLEGIDFSKFPGLTEHPSPNFPANRIPGFSGASSSTLYSYNKQPSFQSPSTFSGNGPPSFGNNKSPPYQIFQGSGSSFNPHKDLSGYSQLTEVNGPKHQFPLEGYSKDPYKTPLTSYEVPLSHTKSHLFEPDKDFDFRKPQNSYSNSGVSSTHSTSHSSIDDGDEQYYPSLPNRYEQEQFHNPAKSNPNKSLPSTVQTITDNDPFSSYYDGVSESQKVSVKATSPTEASLTLDNLYSSTTKRNKSRRKKKPKPVVFPVGHNLDTDDLRDAYGSSSDFHQVAIGADEFLEFEPQKQMKHSKPVGVTKTREEDKSPVNFVLLSSQNKGHGGKPSNHRNPPHNPNYSDNSQILPASDFKTLNLNYFKNMEPNQKLTASKPAGLEDVNILSIQKSNSKSYYAGTSDTEPMLYNGFLPTRRNGGYYRANMDYEMLDVDDESEGGAIDRRPLEEKLTNSRTKKDLLAKQTGDT
ncbi:uncharacterized protein LOC131683543 [Topomyia yanbarensis]|uniref:uncharacterized protein LOC131683543 n=1 Tax=Topomyia yanbarensis TaxID=2498891 RepID=UPI00273AADEC|nr:uncharacterized protein LOC131683543 [Topomyia yanbarensis]